uniref:Uncharacterized protein n=1 Tax=Podoviridae sp. ct8Lf7 TaxID=2827723 RepID=A0A8S5S0U9_9CAUD|nr:MAG TPA: hypothetical protein [Podoviridae sp. ct8Lf7]
MKLLLSRFQPISDPCFASFLVFRKFFFFKFPA